MRCEGCGKAFQPKQPSRARFCSDRCRLDGWVRRKERDARAPLERALVALAARAEALVEQERTALEDRRATLAELQVTLDEAKAALRGEEG